MSTLKVERKGDAVVSTHRADLGDIFVTYKLQVSVKGGTAVIRFISDSPYVRGVSAGYCSGVQTVRGLPVGRYGEQNSWPSESAHWLNEAKLWVKGTWDLTRGNYSLLGCSLDKGSIADGITYLPRNDGSVAPLREVLTLRFDRDLWQTVPKLENPPSPYARDLKNMVYLDMWDAGFGKCENFLKAAGASVGKAYKFYTTVHVWQTPWYDTEMPNVMPANAGLGGADGMKSLLAAGRAVGYIGLHNNYSTTGPDNGIAVKVGMKPVLDINGNTAGKLQGRVPKASTMLAGAKAIEPAVHAMGTSGIFLDELGAGSIAHAPDWYFYLDFDPGNPSGIMMRDLIAGQRELAEYVKAVHKGPLFTETCTSEYMAGYVDGNDYGVINGSNRTLLPDYKLRRLQPLMASYGMGLYYRYFAAPDQWSKGWTVPGQSYETGDDYRATQLMYGNGAYLFWYDGCPAEFIMTEIGLVGTMQPYYMFGTVADIRYLAQGKWLTLAQVVEQGLPYETRRPVKETFANGYTQIINRTEGTISITTPRGGMTLPKNGFTAWSAKTGLFAFSAIAPGMDYRVDYAEDPSRQILFVNPRGREYKGFKSVTLMHIGKVLPSVGK